MRSRTSAAFTGSCLLALALLALLSTAPGVQAHGWLSYPESRNSRLNAVAPGGLAYDRMSGNGRAEILGLMGNNPIQQPGELKCEA
jgi:predicted carbohydrate-binding protein with CBM5 and CBM33 domain